MAGKYFEDLKEGEVIRGKPLTVTETHIVQFAGITGDDLTSTGTLASSAMTCKV